MAERKPIILYVDDDPDYREVVRAILENGGYEVTEAATGEEGLKVFQGRRPDLVIVDLMMEEVDAGASFVKELRLLGNTAPVYMLTSVGESLNLTTDHVAMGLAGVLQKPVDRENLLRILKTRLGR
jgi:two-component system, NtrC family, nitrogen regulation response regulator NtrX